ncbi:hypothetical protein ACH4Y0_38080 [Streptomyces sp. NPDC020707]|uniref:hypothetical protein n=1 Tax=Streptomyces sp. NPDC020707 TaxID=3365084 RepID=UPI00379C344C
MNFELSMQILSSFGLFYMATCIPQSVHGAFLYQNSEGAADRLAKAGNELIYGFMGMFSAIIVTFVVKLLIGPIPAVHPLPTLSVGVVVGTGRVLLLSSAIVSTAVASYGAWWVPKAERTARRQDIRYALRQADRKMRSSHAWGVLKSSPRIGLRARRQHKALAAATTGLPARKQVSG